MIEFLGAAVGVFLIMWVWVGGYVADFVVWLVSKLTPNSSNEVNIALVIASVFVVLGVIVALTQGGVTTSRGVTPSSVMGGSLAGFGSYIAVRLPGKVRRNREAKSAGQ
jgi:hypothetical protein